MGITASVGAFSGINSGELIESLMSIEQIPLDKMNAKKEAYESEISAYGELSSLVSKLRDSLSSLKRGSFLTQSVTSSDETKVKATVNTEASSGEYEISVTQLAKQGTLSSGYFDSNTTVFNNGTLSISTGDETTDITINYTNNTLAGIRNAINSSGAGVTATLIKGTDGYKLQISSQEGSDSGTFQISATNTTTGSESLSEFSYYYDEEAAESGGNMTLIQSAQDAVFQINGETFTSSTNTVEAITGLTLNLKAVTTASDVSFTAPVNLSVNFDPDAVTETLQGFVDAYNELKAKVDELDVAGEGVLSNDTTLDLIVRQIKSVTTTTFGSSTLAAFGITHDSSGELQIETSKLNKILEKSDFAFLNTLDTMANTFDRKLREMTLFTIPDKQYTLRDKIRDLEEDITEEEALLELKKTQYIKRFAALEQTISELQSSGDSMSNTFSSLNQ
ncbi:flagellar hook-associated 2 domain-containing protein [Candidatus Magnetoovum chiemensis]|nr:flagellar hook-associated 2 domain-containing protein [Candidatus Magnetoovum chiemensis]